MELSGQPDWQTIKTKKQQMMMMIVMMMLRKT
jgi:hypothetical protein